MPDEISLHTIQQLKALENSIGRAFAGIFLLRKATIKTAANGNSFLSIDLSDRTGGFSTNLFNDHPHFELLRSSSEGIALRIEGKVDYYNNRLSPKILKITLVSDEELQTGNLLENLVETAPEGGAALWQEFGGFVDSIGHDELRMTVRGVMEEIGEVFRVSAAAVSMHHAYRHGLLEHTVHMARAARALFTVYPEVDPDLAMAGILLHDTGKTVEYEGSLSTRRSRKGILQGHVVLGYQLVRKYGLKARLDTDRLERLEHIVLSHQGEPEWGAAVYAATPEAVFVSMVDNLDARMGMVQRALRQATPRDEFSERLPGLNTALLVRPIGQSRTNESP